MSNRKRRTEPYKAGDRVVISERYRGAVGPKIHGKPGRVVKVSYPKRGAKFVFVQLDGESDLSQVLTFADELDREEPTLEDKIAEWSADPEGNRLVQAIHDRKVHVSTGPVIHVYQVPNRPVAVGDTVQYLGTLGKPIPRDGFDTLHIRQEEPRG